jgi:DNA repair exonuclease SbcCD nuclease subunit
MKKIMHIADIHLRDSQFGRMERGREFTDSVFNIIDLAHGRSIDTIIASGDILNCPRPSSGNIRDLMEINSRLKDFNMTMLCIPGDHDWCQPSWIKALNSNEGGRGMSHIVDITDQVVTLENPMEYGRVGTPITVYGAPRPCMHPDDFRRSAPTWPKATILVYHGPLKEFAGYPMAPESICLNDMPVDNYKVIALGDLHAAKYTNYKGCLVGYSGPTEYCSSHEKPTKSVTILSFDDAGNLLKFDSDFDIIPIRTRHVIQRVVRNEDDMSELLSDLRIAVPKNPLVQVWHTPDIPSVFGRLCQVADPRKCIVRTQEIAEGGLMEEAVFNSFSDDTEIVMTRPEDFIPQFVPSESPLYTTMLSLCNPDIKPATILDKYIEERSA